MAAMGRFSTPSSSSSAPSCVLMLLVLLSIHALVSCSSSSSYGVNAYKVGVEDKTAGKVRQVRHGHARSDVRSRSQSTSTSTTISYTPAALADEILDLPGIDDSLLSFRQFSGYLPINVTAGRYLFYWYATSEASPATDPVIAWTNGGPGCSGMLGMMTENGPFRPQSDGVTLALNPTRWNLFANTFFWEGPAGVGYSYSETPADLITGDVQTAADNYVAMLAFFDRFPHLLENDFYISGESYAGHYLPQLALNIVEGNIAGVNVELPFRGFLVGNPYTDPVSNEVYGEYPTYWGRQMISAPVYTKFKSACVATEADGIEVTSVGTIISQGNVIDGTSDTQTIALNKLYSDDCLSIMQTISNLIGRVDVYALDFPDCNSSTTFISTTPERKLRAHLNEMSGLAINSMYLECEDDYTTEYLNRLDVVTALHVNQDAVDSWSMCNEGSLQYSSEDGELYMEPYYLKLLALMPDIKMLVYSGDDDAVCSTSGTQYWIYGLGLTVTKAWTPWYLNNQVAGYIVHFDGLTFMTVHTAGHMVPQTQGERALFLAESFINGDLPYSSEASATAVAKAAKHKLSKHRHRKTPSTTTTTTTTPSSVSVGASPSPSPSPSSSTRVVPVHNSRYSASPEIEATRIRPRRPAHHRRSLARTTSTSTPTTPPTTLTPF